MGRTWLASSAVAVLLCLAVAQAARVYEHKQGALGGAMHTGDGPSFDPPKWYHGHDGPIFEVTQTGDDKELRHYHPTVWATTNISNSKVDEALDEGSQRLDNYWGGDNKGKSKIDETVPTLAILYVNKEQPGTVSSDSVTIQYFVPHELHDAPPAPDAKEVNVLRFGDQSIWVKTFGGYAHEKEILDQGFRFLKELEDASVKVRTDAFGFAYYDKMYHIINRHNEIWVWADEEPSVSDQTEAVANEAVGQARHAAQAATQKVQTLLGQHN